MSQTAYYKFPVMYLSFYMLTIISTCSRVVIFFFNSQNCIHAVYSKFIFEICYLGYLNFYLTSLKIVSKKKCKFNKVTMYISKTLDLSYFEKSRSHSIIQVASLLISFYLPYVLFDYRSTTWKTSISTRLCLLLPSLLLWWKSHYWYF